MKTALIAYLTRTGIDDFPFGVGTFCYGGAWGYLVCGDTLENCIKIAESSGYKILNKKEYV